jgi:hypothetical protein
VLDRRALNRALLERQLLLRRSTRPVPWVVEHLVGMQAQVPRDPYVGLWARVEGFHAADLERLIDGRLAVRMPFLRATIHLVTAKDAGAVRPALDPVLRRMFSSGSPFGRALGGMDLRPVLRYARTLIEEQPRTSAELRALLGERWPDHDAASLAAASTLLLPVVQVPPRGLWTRGGRPTWTTLEHWLGRPMSGASTVHGLVRRYLAAFGPASAADIRTWSGLTGVAEVLDGFRAELRAFRDGRGTELVDVPDAPLPDPDVPAPPRFLPEYDNALLSHRDRARVMDDDLRRSLIGEAAVGLGAVLVDGFARATWKIERGRGSAHLRVRPLSRLSRSERADVAAEGRVLLTSTDPDADHEVRFEPS